MFSTIVFVFVNRTSDELSFTHNKMHGFSPVDGFLEISEGLADMIKYVANEPSVGLFYIQQHTQNAVPNIITLKNSIELKSHEMNLHTEDSEDSITMMRSMKQLGPHIADDMIHDIKKSLAIMSAKQPKKGLIQTQMSGFSFGRTSSPLGPTDQTLTARDREEEDATDSYFFSTVLKSAKKKAGSFKWPQIDVKDTMWTIGEKPVSGSATELFSVAGTSSSSTVLEHDSDELPLSSRVTEEESKEGQHGEEEGINVLSEEYESFRANREAKLLEWLEGNGKQESAEGAKD